METCEQKANHMFIYSFIVQSNYIINGTLQYHYLSKIGLFYYYYSEKLMWR